MKAVTLCTSGCNIVCVGWASGTSTKSTITAVHQLHAWACLFPTGTFNRHQQAEQAAAAKRGQVVAYPICIDDRHLSSCAWLVLTCAFPCSRRTRGPTQSVSGVVNMSLGVLIPHCCTACLLVMKPSPCRTRQHAGYASLLLNARMPIQWRPAQPLCIRDAGRVQWRTGQKSGRHATPWTCWARPKAPSEPNTASESVIFTPSGPGAIIMMHAPYSEPTSQTPRQQLTQCIPGYALPQCAHLLLKSWPRPFRKIGTVGSTFQMAAAARP